MLDLRESAVYQVIFGEGRREGREEGREDGREAGREEAELRGLRASLLRVLEVRFGPVPAAVAGQVGQVTEAGLVSALLDRALVAPDLDSFSRQMAAALLASAPPWVESVHTIAAEQPDP